MTNKDDVQFEQPRRSGQIAIPKTLVLGAALIVFIEVFLFVDVAHRGGAVVPLPPGETLVAPVGVITKIGRWAAMNVTPICWIGYLLVFDGLLTLLSRRRGDRTISSFRARPNRFIVAWLTSIPVWCFFDYINFRWLDAWRYHGLPADAQQRYVGYFVAFAAISPGMFIAAQWFSQLGLRRLVLPAGKLRQRLPWVVMLAVIGTLVTCVLLLMHGADTHAAERFSSLSTTLMTLGPGVGLLIATRRLDWTSFGFGVGLTAWAILVRDPLGNMTIWIGLIFLLDPIAAWLGGPSILRDWQAGRWGRMISLFTGGALCGLLWEFWNYWAIAKWSYHLPFLGSLEQYRYFEMPLLGFLGFLPFAVECWVALNVIVAVMDRAGLRIAEPLPGDDQIM